MKNTKTKKMVKKPKLAKDTDYSKMDMIIMKHLSKFQKELLGEAVTREKMCGCCLAQRLSLHLNCMMAGILEVAVPGFGPCTSEGKRGRHE